MENWYFETSAVNYLFKAISVESALSTKQLTLNKGRSFKLSPLTLWEILLTSNEEKREGLIYFCQHLFDSELLPSPGELIIPYIQQGMPKFEKVRVLKSNSQIAQTWKDLVDDRTKTFVLDYENLRNRARFIQYFTKNVHELVKHGDLLITSNMQFSGIDQSLSVMVNELPFVNCDVPATTDELLHYKVALYYIIMILCVDADFENDLIKLFWDNLGIYQDRDKIQYVLTELSTLVHTGPFAVMAYMTIFQASGKYPRGVWFDSLHSMYVTYVDKVFTTDGHFKGFRDIIPEPILRQKIHLMSEVELTHHPMNQFGVLRAEPNSDIKS